MDGPSYNPLRANPDGPERHERSQQAGGSSVGARKTNRGLRSHPLTFGLSRGYLTFSLVGHRAPGRPPTRRNPRISIPASWY